MGHVHVELSSLSTPLSPFRGPRAQVPQSCEVQPPGGRNRGRGGAPTGRIHGRCLFGAGKLVFVDRSVAYGLRV